MQPDAPSIMSSHEQPTYEEQALEDQLTQEQFDNELKKDLEVMLTQKQCDKEEGGAEGRAGEAVEGKKEEDDDDDLEEGYVSPRILSHVKPEGGQQRKIWTRILTRTRR